MRVYHQWRISKSLKPRLSINRCDKIFTRFVPNPANLKKCKLSLSGNYFGGEFFQGLAEHLEKMISVEELSIIISTKCFSVEEASCLCISFPTVKRMTLDLDQFNTMDEFTLRFLNKSLPTMKSLENLGGILSNSTLSTEVKRRLDTALQEMVESNRAAKMQIVI